MAGSSKARPGSYRVTKRMIDVMVAATVLAVFAPVIAVTALAIRLSMGGPVLFRQQRPGLHGELFTIYKFRTMRDGPGSDAQRLTPVGRAVRSASLDELPQLVNVLRGDMSLVGPRPLLARYLPLYDERQARRQDVLPGITGLAQINGRNALPWAERFELDVQYVEQCNLRLDLSILWRTVRKTAAREGISAASHATAPEYQGTPTMPERGAA